MDAFFTSSGQVPAIVHNDRHCSTMTNELFRPGAEVVTFRSKSGESVTGEVQNPPVQESGELADPLYREIFEGSKGGEQQSPGIQKAESVNRKVEQEIANNTCAAVDALHGDAEVRHHTNIFHGAATNSYGKSPVQIANETIRAAFARIAKLGIKIVW